MKASYNICMRVCVEKDLANRWTDMFLFYSKASYKKSLGDGTSTLHESFIQYMYVCVEKDLANRWTD